MTIVLLEWVLDSAQAWPSLNDGLLLSSTSSRMYLGNQRADNMLRLVHIDYSASG